MDVPQLGETTHEVPLSRSHRQREYQGRQITIRVWSPVLFRAVLHLDCVSRPSYANLKARYGIKSRRQILAHIFNVAYKTHKDTQITLQNRQKKKLKKKTLRESKKYLYRSAFIFDSDEILRRRRARNNQFFFFLQDQLYHSSILCSFIKKNLAIKAADLSQIISTISEEKNMLVIYESKYIKKQTNINNHFFFTREFTKDF